MIVAKLRSAYHLLVVNGEIGRKVLVIISLFRRPLRQVSVMSFVLTLDAALGRSWHGRYVQANPTRPLNC